MLKFHMYNITIETISSNVYPCTYLPAVNLGMFNIVISFEDLSARRTRLSETVPNIAVANI